MKTEERAPSSTADSEAMQIDDPVRSKPTPTKSSTQSSAMVPVKQEDDRDEVHDKGVSEEREGPPKKSTPRKSNTKSSSSSRRGGYDGASSSSYQYPKGGRYPPPGRPYAPPPPYGYDPHYRPPPPHPHYQMPPMHPGQPGGYPYPPPPPNYHPYGSYPHPGSMPYPPPSHPMPPNYPSSENASITSSKSKSSKSKLPRKKRTIEHRYSPEEPQHRGHRRTYSNASTASTLSETGLSLCSQAKEDNPLTRASPKRRRGHDSNPISVNPSFEDQGTHRRLGSSASTVESAARFQKLSVNDSKSRDKQTNIFLTLSTSPINAEDDEATPVKKNRHKKSDDKSGIDAFMSRTKSVDSAAEIDKIIDRHAETPTPPLPGSSETNVLTDEHLLNRHLRGQTFTPLPQSNAEGSSPSNKISTSNSFGAIQAQLSWSIAGDAPSLGDLAEWEEDRKNRPQSTTSNGSNNSRAMALSPNSFTMWKEDDPNNQHRTLSRDESLRLSMLSPHSDMDADERMASGTTTPLPFFFGDNGQGEERENSLRRTFSSASDKTGNKEGHYSERESRQNYRRVPENVHSIFVHRSGGSSKRNKGGSRWGHHGGRHDSGRGGMRMPPTPAYSDHDHFGRSPPGRDGPPDYYPHYMGPPPHMPDRIRNLRGRAPPHHAPMPLQVPPPISSHHSLTSPMGMPSKMWGVPHPSPHHMPPPPLELNPSKRKCVPLKPPIPSKFQGDIEKVKGAQVPEFTSLVNFPSHMSQKQSVNLPEGMRCCVMCGQACPCSSSNKSKKCHKKEVAPLDKQNGFAIIPTQNKGLCTLCDVNVWVVCQSGLEIKWCKGCKNFRPWAAFGDKGLATKCLRCRERQREKYALQKEEKEKARLLAKNKAKA